jgi:guanosine-3',5'-bis(diphosphate) 3'-pyrophosphohydrolase
MKRAILRRMAEEDIAAQVSGRQKHLYSLWRKLQRPEIDNDFTQIHDIVALRIFVDTAQQCYAALGIVHALYKPVPNLGVSDFIAQPKPNGYQSIHTKVFGPQGRIVEVQIRTFAMHIQAEHGVAAHWAYSEKKSKSGVGHKELEQKSVKVTPGKLQWVKQLVEWQNEINDTEEFYQAVKFDALNKRNFVFSPKGDVFDLPANATPVDFAYAVHTRLGEFIAGAKVNGKIVPLDYKLPSGCVVEIVKSKNAHQPNRRWLETAVTTAAKREIHKKLRKES